MRLVRRSDGETDFLNALHTRTISRPNANWWAHTAPSDPPFVLIAAPLRFRTAPTTPKYRWRSAAESLTSRSLHGIMGRPYNERRRRPATKPTSPYGPKIKPPR